MAVRDEVILTAGGEDGSHPRNLTTWAAPLDRPWRPAPGMPEPLGEVAGGVIGQWLYLVGQGSRSTLVLNIGTGEWGNGRAFSQRPAATHHHAAEVVGEELYLIGGLEWTSVDIVQIYNPSRDEWRLGTSLRYPVGSSASAVIEGKIYLAGGIVGDTTTRQAVVFEPRLSVWRPIAPMPRARNHAASGTDGRRLFVFGGRGPGSGDGNRVANGYDDLQIYDPDTDTWVVSDGRAGSPLALPQARGGMGKAAYLGGEFYVIGGETLDGAGASAGGVYDRVDIYDPIRNQWRQGPPMPTARHGIFPVVYGPTIWVAGGGVKAAYSLSSVVEVLLLSASGH
jgi:N-acetylneuraminic acid mutarotase